MIPNKPQGSGFFESFGYAWRGICETAQGRNFKVQAGVGVLALVLGAIFQISVYEWIAVLVCIGMVLGSECFNTSIENVVDLASPEIHPLAKIAKDAAAGAVLCFSISSLLVGIIIFLPKLLVVFGLMG